MLKKQQVENKIFVTKLQVLEYEKKLKSGEINPNDPSERPKIKPQDFLNEEGVETKDLKEARLQLENKLFALSNPRLVKDFNLALDEDQRQDFENRQAGKQNIGEGKDILPDSAAALEE